MGLDQAQFLSATAGSAAWLVRAETEFSVQQPSLNGGRRVATLPLDLPAAGRVPLETPLDSGLDARLFADLSKLGPDTLVTSNGAFFIRTAAPPRLPARDQWSISLSGRVQEPVAVKLEAFERDVKDAGVTPLECSENSAPTSALISAAAWEGIPMAAILDEPGSA